MTVIEKSIVISRQTRSVPGSGNGRARVFAALLPSLAALAAFVCCAPAHAVNLPEAAKQEVNQLFGRLESSDCQFNRNGSWHNAKDARAHLQKKFDYLQDKGLISSTEQFIELGASKSSVTGTPYMVQCQGTPKTESSAWLLTQLKQVRQQAPKK